MELGELLLTLVGGGVGGGAVHVVLAQRLADRSAKRAASEAMAHEHLRRDAEDTAQFILAEWGLLLERAAGDEKKVYALQQLPAKYPHSAMGLVGDEGLLRRLFEAELELLSITPGDGVTDEQYERCWAVFQAATNTASAQIDSIVKTGAVQALTPEVVVRLKDEVRRSLHRRT